MSTYEFLRVERDGPVATVTLDRPPVNAVHQPMYGELRALFTELPREPGVRAIVLIGAGRHFCAGNDLDEFVTLDPVNTPGRMKVAREAFWAISDAPVPVVGAIHGVALGTGLALAASCDVLVAAEGTRLGLPEIKVGVMGGGRHLSRLAPPGLVRYMMLSGELVPAEEFVRLGSILRLTSPERLLAEAHEVARSFARHSPVALRYAKQAANYVEFADLKGGYEYEQELTGRLSGHPDAKEAVAAVLEKRDPSYAASRAD